MEKHTNQNTQHVITYEDFILDDWLFEMIEDLLTNHPNFYDEINESEE